MRLRVARKPNQHANQPEANSREGLQGKNNGSIFQVEIFRRSNLPETETLKINWLSRYHRSLTVQQSPTNQQPAKGRPARQPTSRKPPNTN
jgi:hypothetical protein